MAHKICIVYLGFRPSQEKDSLSFSEGMISVDELKKYSQIHSPEFFFFSDNEVSPSDYSHLKSSLKGGADFIQGHIHLSYGDREQAPPFLPIGFSPWDWGGNPHSKLRGGGIFATMFAQGQYPSWILSGKSFSAALVSRCLGFFSSLHINKVDSYSFCFVAAFFAEKYHFNQKITHPLANTTFGIPNHEFQSPEDLLAFIHYHKTTFENISVISEALKCPGAENILYHKQAVLSTLFKYAPSLWIKKSFDEICAAFNREDVFNFILDRMDTSDVEFLISENEPALRKKIKTIAFVTYRLHFGGGERVICLQASRFQKMGYQVILFYVKEPAEEIKVFLEGCILLPFAEASRYTEFDRAIGLYQIDLFILHDRNFKASLDLLYFQYRKEIYTIIGIHSMPLADLYENSLSFMNSQLRFFGLASALTCLSSSDEVFYRNRGNKNSFYMPNPLTFNPDSIQVSPLDEPNIIFLGRNDANKNIKQLIEAMPEILKEIPNAQLYVLGDAQLWKNYKGLSRRIRNHIHFEGLKTDISSYLQKASVHVMCSYFEGFPMVWGEAKAYGVPSVITEMNYLELSKYPGYLFTKFGDPKDMADKIILILKDEALRKAMGAEARDSLKNFLDEDIYALWQNLFQALEKGTVSSLRPSKNENSKEILAVYDKMIDRYLRYLSLPSQPTYYHEAPPFMSKIWFKYILIKYFPRGSIQFRILRKITPKLYNLVQSIENHR